MTKKSSKCSERMILYTLRSLKQGGINSKTVWRATAFFFFLNRFKLSVCCYFCERRGVFQYNLHDFSTSIEAKSCPNNCTVVVSIFKINLEDTMHQHFVINHVKRKLQKYKTMYFIKKKLKSTMWCQVNKLLIFQFLLKNLFYEINV